MLGISFSTAQEARPAPPASTEKKTDEKSEKTEADYRNWFDVSVGGTLIDGDKAQFMQRHGVPKGAFGGVESFHYEQDVGKKGLLQIDGRGIFDNHDYSLKLSIDHPDIGYLRGGYREYRSWYDGSGGYFPLNGQWFSLYDDELAVDRGETWFEGGLTLPGKPILTFRYSHQFRDGRKDSTIWGDTTRTGLTGGTSTRGIVPTFWDIDEERDIFALDAKHTIGNTDVGAGLRYETSEISNSRNIHRRPGEAADRYLTHREGFETDMFNVHAFTETRLTESILFTTGYSFTTLDTDVSGSRIYGADYDPVYDPLFGRRQQRDEGFLNLSGGSQMNQHVANLNFMLSPWEHVTIVPALRVEHQDQDGFARFDETNVGGAPAFTSTAEELLNLRDRGFTDVSESMEARYTGVPNWAFYVRGEWLQGEGDLTERELILHTGDVGIFRETDSTRLTQKYIAGLNWYAAKQFNVAAQYYHKVRANDYDHLADSAANTGGDRYPAYIVDQDFETDDVNFRVTWRPLNNLTFVTRYDFQLSTIDTRQDQLSEVQSAQSTAHIFSQSVSWVPWSRLFLQGSINYVLDETDTPADEALPRVVLDSQNDYWNANATAGLVLNEKTDLEATYFYYRADNYEDNSVFSQPYGAGAEEHGITAALIHRINARMQWNLKYGFFTNRDETAGGYNNYDAHLVYSSFRYRF